MEEVAGRTQSSGGLQLLAGSALASAYGPAKMLLPLYGCGGGQGGGGRVGAPGSSPRRAGVTVPLAQPSRLQRSPC